MLIGADGESVDDEVECFASGEVNVTAVFLCQGFCCEVVFLQLCCRSDKIGCGHAGEGFVPIRENSSQEAV